MVRVIHQRRDVHARRNRVTARKKECRPARPIRAAGANPNGSALRNLRGPEAGGPRTCPPPWACSVCVGRPGMYLVFDPGVVGNGEIPSGTRQGRQASNFVKPLPGD